MSGWPICVLRHQRLTVGILRQVHSGLPRPQCFDQSLQGCRTPPVEIGRDHLQVPVAAAEAQLSKPVGKVQPPLSAEHACAPASRGARVGMLLSRNSIAQKCVHRVQSAVIVILACAAANAAQECQEIAPVRDPFRSPFPIRNFFNVRALDVLPPSRTSQVGGHASNHQRLTARVPVPVPGF